MNYKLLRPFLFSLNPELSHNFSLKAMKLLYDLKLFKPKKLPDVPTKVLGMEFKNPIGLAAGLDKNGDYIDELASLGFGFIEVGTVTPKPQVGNPKPRLFRLKNQHAIINRMGFNNKGVDHLIQQVKKTRYRGILGINIGKNATTSLEYALDDYLICLEKVYPYASYITINISSPNTPGLRRLQGKEYLNNLLDKLKKKQLQLADKNKRYVPILIKVSPDLSLEEIQTMASIFIEKRIDGIIATNTTLDKKLVEGSPFGNETGGLSGEPLFDKATNILKQFKKLFEDNPIAIIASGGIMSAKQAKAKLEAGADLIQLYTGLIYEGPDLIKSCCDLLINER